MSTAPSVVLLDAAPALTPFGLPRDMVLRRILLGGALLRLVVAVPLYPANYDDHYGVIVAFLRTHAMPAAASMHQAYHPPLYYLLAAPFAAVGGLRGAEVLSLVLSLLNLWLLGRVITTTELIRSIAARRHALAIAAFLPQFVIFGLFVSNDCLSYAVGTLFFIVVFAYLRDPGVRMLLALAVMGAIGLLTKGTFLAFLPVIPGAVALAGWRRKFAVPRVLAQAGLALLLACSLGSYKYVQNYRELGRVLVHNMEFPAYAPVKQRGTITGVGSFVDLNVPKLVIDPFDRTEAWHSVPMLLYASTWYSYFRDSNFLFIRRHPVVASLLCLAGVIPTALILLGIGRLLGRLGERAASEDVLAHDRLVTGAVLLAGTLGIVVAAGIRFDARTCFQGRLLFPALLGTLLLMARGFDGIRDWRPGAARWLTGFMIAGYVAFAAYYVLEIGAVVTQRSA